MYSRCQRKIEKKNEIRCLRVKISQIFIFSKGKIKIFTKSAKLVEFCHFSILHHRVRIFNQKWENFLKKEK